MIKALAPRMRQGCSWVWLSIALASGFQLTPLFAQQPTPKKEAAAEKKVETDPSADDSGDTAGGGVEVYADPSAVAALKIFKSVPGTKPPRPDHFKQVKAMASSGQPVDREVIKDFVNGMAYSLTDKSNINALIEPKKTSGRPPATLEIQKATDSLLDPLHTAKLAKNTSFLNAYTDVLIDILPKLLDNNLISRMQAIIVLGNTGNGRATKIFLDQIKLDEQTVWVKMWCFHGLTVIVENGTKELGAEASVAGKVISDYLDANQELPWPVEYRALEALGSMRQASMPNAPQTVNMASTAMRYLADTERRPEVRATAAWALSMLRVNTAVKNYNYRLIAYNTGSLAADLGTKINEVFHEKNRTLSEALTGLLVTPIYQTFSGTDGVRESGLLKVPGGNPDLATTRQIADLSKEVAKASVELVRAPNGQIQNFKKALGDRVAALKAFLDKNPPKEYSLVPKGQEFRLVKPQVAAAAPAPGGK